MDSPSGITSNIAWSTKDKITVKGFDLCNDLMGKISLGDMAFLQIMDRLPTERESFVFNAIAVVLVEHGMTPSAIAARLTLAGAPEAMQAAVAAGLSGLGSVFVGSMEDAARILQAAIPDAGAEADILALAKDIVDRSLREKRSIPGIGHHIHKPVDPRAPRLIAIAQSQGYDGPYMRLMAAISLEAQNRLGKPLPMNATGAIAAVASELGIPWNIVRGIGVISRSIGLVSHILEEQKNPIARKIKQMVEDQATAHLRQDAGGS